MGDDKDRFFNSSTAVKSTVRQDFAAVSLPPSADDPVIDANMEMYAALLSGRPLSGDAMNKLLRGTPSISSMTQMHDLVRRLVKEGLLSLSSGVTAQKIAAEMIKPDKKEDEGPEEIIKRLKKKRLIHLHHRPWKHPHHHHHHHHHHRHHHCQRRNESPS
jgi:hypothetical protein